MATLVTDTCSQYSLAHIIFICYFSSYRYLHGGFWPENINRTHRHYM